LPNAGKSSHLQELTNAQPKIGNYEFTTLEPNIGMLGSIALADIPGLIEGAHDGKGLGIQFLKHIEKTKLLVHCIDSVREDIKESYATIRKELGEYSKEMLQKPEIILLTKTDEITPQKLQKKVLLLKALKKPFLTVSVLDETSITHLKESLEKYVKEQAA
jgi:GTP-binding protein